MSDEGNSGFDLEACDYTDATMFERRFLPVIYGGLTVFQEIVICAVLFTAIAASSMFTFLVLQPSVLTSIAFVLFCVFLGGFVGLSWSKRIDRLNRDMKKTQGQYVIDEWHRRHRSGHWVNGRRIAAPDPVMSIVLSVGSRHPRKEGRREHRQSSARKVQSA